ncbi:MULTISPECIES: RsmE family RNA methyltransferase [unclassified Butyrivibrio]|jgi:16S rRNA (uracil1498-N3)-methyltransferase|uniref:RsmE family RNA methyltransferase n=1 Tax=unclassified Butyrivibrio TaxID=2639466 RepID=UPI0003B5C08A|nr:MULTISPECIES: 16S rRNA (uracil(1498)-N(3))-methyltransferase [unclassified Butyrivibrio]MDC7292885.1 16S rRNA (uracil(1498)-N(3))-methyltransferase [Butyrivibrio sp. DSM 10294]
MYHFFVESSQLTPDYKKVEITGADYNHIAHVLRMKAGEQFSVSIRDDEEGKELFYEIEEIDDSHVIGNLCFVEEVGNELPSRIYLFQGLPKVDKMELIIQKAVELGAYQIIPMASKRCVVKLDEKKAQSKIKRWQAISEAAAKQSKRAIIPEVAMPMTMKQAVEFCKDMAVKLIPYENAEHIDETKKLIEGIKPGQDIAVFIGPEGGFSDEEIELCRNNDIKPITLGKRILRTETAGFTIISWLMYHLEG